MLYKTSICTFYQRGCCGRGERCFWAHGIADLRPVPDFRCTRLCYNWLYLGGCSRQNCLYAHSREELRGNGRALRLCNYFFRHGHCPKKNKCPMAHTVEELDHNVREPVLAQSRGLLRSAEERNAALFRATEGPRYGADSFRSDEGESFMDLKRGDESESTRGLPRPFSARDVGVGHSDDYNHRKDGRPQLRDESSYGRPYSARDEPSYNFDDRGHMSYGESLHSRPVYDDAQQSTGYGEMKKNRSSYDIKNVMPDDSIDMLYDKLKNSMPYSEPPQQIHPNAYGVTAGMKHRLHRAAREDWPRSAPPGPPCKGEAALEEALFTSAESVGEAPKALRASDYQELVQRLLER